MEEAQVAELTSKINTLHKAFGEVMDTAKANEITLALLFLCTTHFNEFLRSIMEKTDPVHGAQMTEELASIANSWVKTGQLKIWGSRDLSRARDKAFEP